MTVKLSERAQYATRGGHGSGVAPILLHEAHTAALRGREAAAAAGTSGDWGARLMLLTLIRLTERLLFSSITCEDMSNAAFECLL